MEDKRNLKACIQQYGSVALYSMIGALVMTYFSCTSCRSDIWIYTTSTIFSGVMWFIMWVGNSELTNYISKHIPWVKFPVKRLVVGVLSTVVFTILVAITILKLWEYSRGFKFNSYTEFVIISLIITFLISFFLHGREFLMQWKQSAVEAERYQKQSMEATYENLKSQVNPHFLFNSLNALTNLVYEDQDKAAKFIKQLSEVYRYVLDTRDKEVVLLEEELKFLQAYVYLQQIRFGNKLKVEINLNGVQSMVAPLAIQMLFENAIKHNEISEDNPLTISIYKEADFVIIENTLQPKSQLGQESSGLGLENIKKRYAFLSDKLVEVVETDTVFQVKLPVISRQ
jgi:sensor histidine kinase YesM